jgi:hypothetical protein
MDRDIKKPNESGRNNYKTLGEQHLMHSTVTSASQMNGKKFKEVLLQIQENRRNLLEVQTKWDNLIADSRLKIINKMLFMMKYSYRRIR